MSTDFKTLFIGSLRFVITPLFLVGGLFLQRTLQRNIAKCLDLQRTICCKESN